MQKRILVVGEDADFIRELRSEGRSEVSDWHFHCVRTGMEGLAALHQSAHTAVVANWRLPGGMSGSALLDEVFRHQPACLRFVRTEVEDQKATMKSTGTSHRLLFRPTQVSTLKEAVLSALALEGWLPAERVRALMGNMPRVPSPPQLYFEVVSQLDSPTSSLDDIAQTISRDPALTAKLLQLVNSAVFALQLRVNEPNEAIGYLGLETTKSLVLLAHTFSHFDDLVTPGFSVDQLWQHSYATGKCARGIAEEEVNDPGLGAQAFTGGLLHDIGKLVLGANHAALFQQAVHLARETRIELWEAELQVFGTHHAEIGGCLLATWGLPGPIVEAVALHHRPIRLSDAGFTPLVAVHAANVLTQSQQSEGRKLVAPSFDMEFLLHSGCAERVNDWMLLGSGPRAQVREAVGL